MQADYMDVPYARDDTPNAPPHPMEEIDADMDQISWEIIRLLAEAHA